MKLKLLPLEKMNNAQQLVYNILPVGNMYSTNLKREELRQLGFTDRRGRLLIKSLVAFLPVVADSGYFIADSVGDIDKYINNMQQKINGIQEIIDYLLLHRKKLVPEDEF